jgi:hypothetical protein
MDPPPPFSVRHITSIVIQNQVIQKRGPVIDCLTRARVFGTGPGPGLPLLLTTCFLLCFQFATAIVQPIGEYQRKDVHEVSSKS